LYSFDDLLFDLNSRDRFQNRASQAAKRVEMSQENRPPIDELAGVKMFKEV